MAEVSRQVSPASDKRRKSETFEARASVVEGAQRDELYANRVALMPNFAAYQAKVTRTIPVVVLTRKA